VLNHQPSRREKENVVLALHIKESFQESRGTYGSPRVRQDLKELGFKVGRNRVARIMREQGITGTPPRQFRLTTDSRHALPIADNRLNREFEVKEPNKVWATDITYIRTWEGWLYLAVVIDLFSQRVVGWSMNTQMKSSLVLDALAMALGMRQPRPGLLHHSDRGSQYASHDYQHALRARGIICSMSRKADCWDNAVVESFFGTLKTDLLYRRSWPSTKMARNAVVEYIEVFYNRQRRHSHLGYISPAEFERRHEMKIAKAA
jgi:transposase InsO family protein